MLSLTKTGKSVYDEIVPVAYEFEQELLECFSDAERQEFSELVYKLFEHADDLHRGG